jgi:hypothetical protein
VQVTAGDLISVSRADGLLVLDSGILFDGSNLAAAVLAVGAKVGAIMRSSQASPGDIWLTLLQVDGRWADAGRHPATGLG